MTRPVAVAIAVRKKPVTANWLGVAEPRASGLHHHFHLGIRVQSIAFQQFRRGIEKLEATKANVATATRCFGRGLSVQYANIQNTFSFSGEEMAAVHRWWHGRAHCHSRRVIFTATADASPSPRRRGPG
jgi:hypothetical protein